MKTRTNCRCCSALCGIVVETQHGRVLKVSGDRDNPRTQGYLCPKGASLPSFHHHAERLLQPRLRGAVVDWTVVLDDLGAQLRHLIERHGADSIAVYQGTGAVSDSLGVMALGRLLRAIGSRQFYCAATVDAAPALRAAELVTGSMWELHPVWLPEDEAARLVLYLGSNPLVSHGYFSILPNPANRLKRFRERGGKIWVVDPRRTRTAALADRHLAIRPGADAILLAWLIRELLERGADREDFPRLTTVRERAALAQALRPFTLQRAVDATGIAGAALEELLAAIRAAGRLAIAVGTGITFGADALVTEWLRWVLLIVTGSLDRPGGMFFNPGWLTPLEQRAQWQPAPPAGVVEPGPKSRPDLRRLLYQQPCAALVDEIEAGQVRALLVAGGSPLTAFPDPARSEAALRRLDALVSIDILHTPLNRFATHALPAAGQLERADILVETRTVFVPQVLPPVGAAKPMWWILAQLGRRLGVDVLDGLDPDHTDDVALLRGLAACGRDSADALLAAGPDGIDPPRLYGWVRNGAPLPEGRWRLLPPAMLERLSGLLTRDAQPRRDALLLISARQLTRTNSTQYLPLEKSREDAGLRVHPHCAAQRGLHEGDRVRVASDAGELRTTVKLDDTLIPGVVALSHAWMEANPCALTSARAPIDPLTGQPVMGAFAVTVEALRE